MAAIVAANCVALPTVPGAQKKIVHIITPAAASADTLDLTTLAPGAAFAAAGVDSIMCFDNTSVPNAAIPCTWVNATSIVTIDPAGALAATVFSLIVVGNAL